MIHDSFQAASVKPHRVFRKIFFAATTLTSAMRFTAQGLVRLVRDRSPY